MLAITVCIDRLIVCPEEEQVLSPVPHGVGIIGNTIIYGQALCIKSKG
jgi:hypothetical protein